MLRLATGRIAVGYWTASVSRDLEDYRAKRDFARTPEPAPEGPADVRGAARFSVQRHDARALHFDLRVEIDGVLASWAVPKGPPLREGMKRLAVRTEDHPLEYLSFSGRIPEGEYGAGEMTVWDSGTYETEERKDGEWKLVLSGAKLWGNYHLIRTGERSGREEWLLFRSASGPAGPPDPRERMPNLRPMLASASTTAPTGDDWAHELKWDGFRTLALVSPDGGELRSRTGKDLSKRLSGLVDLRRDVRFVEAILDGEVAVLDKEGRASFQDLQAGLGSPVFLAFDLLYADGEWLLDMPWRERKSILREGVSGSHGLVLLSDDVPAEGTRLLDAAAAQGVEGIVAKRRDSDYRPGARSKDWVKVKIRPEAEFVIGGWSEGQGSRRGSIGSVHVGELAEGDLRYRGLVGSGLGPDDALELEERLAPLRTDTPPFVDGPDGSERDHWVRPEVRCEVQYAEVTREGRLRAPVLREVVSDGSPGAAASRETGESDGRELRDGDRAIRLTNLGKVFWPEGGITKGDVIDHYLRVAEVLVPHLAGRPLILKRYPNGITAPFFFQHNLPDNAPDWLGRAELSRSGRDGDETNTYAMVDDALGLLWIANLGNIDINPWQSRAERPDEPTQLLFDLDPADGLRFEKVSETARLLHEELEMAGLRGYPRTSGASGMHVFVPLTPGHTFESVRLFATVVGERLKVRRPDLVTLEARKVDRGQRVYLDANQNGRGRSIASVYSLRPRPGAPVATPLDWDEVDEDLDPRRFTSRVVSRRIASEGDLFASALTDLQELGPAAARLAG